MREAFERAQARPVFLRLLHRQALAQEPQRRKYGRLRAFVDDRPDGVCREFHARSVTGPWPLLVTTPAKPALRQVIRALIGPPTNTGVFRAQGFGALHLAAHLSVSLAQRVVTPGLCFSMVVSVKSFDT